MLRKYGPDMRDVTVVFPSQRAGLFLSQELAAHSAQPVWAPRYITMGNLFQSLSPLSVADPIDCICLLHKLYLEHVGEHIRQQEGPDALARETLDRVREFVKNNPTVYLSTHCPEGYENLEMNRVMKL